MKNFVSIWIGLATASLALGYGLGSSWAGSGLIVAGGLLGLAGRRLNRAWLPDLGLAAAVGVAAGGMWQDLPAGWMLAGVVAALAAWDLAHWERRRRWAAQVSNETGLQRRHLRQVAMVAGVGLLLGGAALSFELEFGLGWAMGLGLLLIFGLGQIVRAAREPS
ncbi:MAG: hypothetical protein AB1801_08405 [Chloroflexota bacterium]